jgi:hypothetical protein
MLLLAVYKVDAEDPALIGDELLNHANKVLLCLKSWNYEELASLVHKDKGVVFAPYAFVEKDAVKFTAAELKTLKSSDEFTWGYSHGTGEPINLSVEHYFSTFIFDQDFIHAPVIGVDELVKTGNTLSNLDKVFPGARYVYYHFPGFDPEYVGFDWVTLRLVFEKIGEAWMLVAVVHDCWTV